MSQLYWGIGLDRSILDPTYPFGFMGSERRNSLLELAMGANLDVVSWVFLSSQQWCWARVFSVQFAKKLDTSLISWTPLYRSHVRADGRLAPLLLSLREWKTCSLFVGRLRPRLGMEAHVPIKRRRPGPSTSVWGSWARPMLMGWPSGELVGPISLVWRAQ
jgi:hypothetical protein